MGLVSTPDQAYTQTTTDLEPILIRRHITYERLVKPPGPQQRGVDKIWSTGERLGRQSQVTKAQWRNSPCGCQHIHAVQAFCTIHLGQKLVDHTICYSCAVVSPVIHDVSSSARIGRVMPHSSLPLRSYRVKFVKEEDTWLGCRRPSKDIANLCCKISVGKNCRATSDRTDFSLAPMYLLRSSGPLTLMKCRPHSFATADANSVLPQPG